MSWGALIGAALSAGAQGAGAVANFLGQKKNLSYQKDMQNETWNREDTAVQRRKADLVAAGLSPVLAAGSAAQTSAPIRTESAQIDTGAIASAGETVGKGVQLSMDMKQNQENISKTQAETAAIQAQENKTRVETDFMLQNNPTAIASNKQRYELEKATQSSNIIRAAEEAKSVGLDNANKAINNKLDRLKVTQAEIDIVKGRISVTAARLGIPDKLLDITAKRVAINLKENELENAQFDTDFYHSRGLPRNLNFGFAQPAVGIGGMATKMLNDLKRAKEYKDYYKFKGGE